MKGFFNRFQSGGGGKVKSSVGGRSREVEGLMRSDGTSATTQIRWPLGTREVEFGDANEDLLVVSLFWVLA
jgi:hypothetical protein